MYIFRRVFAFQITVITLNFANTWLESTNNLKYLNLLFSPSFFIPRLRYKLLDRHVICVSISVYMSVCPPNSISELGDGFSRYWVRRVSTTANSTTLLLIFYCGAGTTSARRTFRLVVILINYEIFRDRNLITALRCLFKVTEQKRFTIIAEVFEALIEGLRGVCLTT